MVCLILLAMINVNIFNILIDNVNFLNILLFVLSSLVAIIYFLKRISGCFGFELHPLHITMHYPFQLTYAHRDTTTANLIQS